MNGAPYGYGPYVGFDPAGWLEQEWQNVREWPSTFAAHAIEKTAAGKRAAHTAAAASSAAEDISQASKDVSAAAREMEAGMRVLKVVAMGSLAVGVLGVLYAVLDKS